MTNERLHDFSLLSQRVGFARFFPGGNSRAQVATVHREQRRGEHDGQVTRVHLVVGAALGDAGKESGEVGESGRVFHGKKATT